MRTTLARWFNWPPTNPEQPWTPRERLTVRCCRRRSGDRYLVRRLP